MKIQLDPIRSATQTDIITLMNDKRLRQHMPLAQGDFNEANYRSFIDGIEALWVQYGFGPWAIMVDGAFVGWGGLQPELGDADIALVLHPKYWGLGKRIYDEIIRRAFVEMGFDSVTVLLPPSRTRIKGILRLGFQPDGMVEIEGEAFVRYRLHKASK